MDSQINFGLVSIVMPVYNDAQYLESSILSVLGQTYANWELLIVDDCSIDGSVSVIKSFQDPRIILVQLSRNAGAANARNVALNRARGKYISFLDADDYWIPEKLFQQINFMIKNGYSFSCSYYFEADETTGKKFLVTCPYKITFRKMKKCNYLGCLTVVYDREQIGKVNASQDLKKRNDYALWLQISRKTPCYCLPQSLASYRKRSGSISSVSIKSKIYWQTRLYKQYLVNNIVVAWLLAIRCAIYTLLKRLFYVKRINF